MSPITKPIWYDPFGGNLSSGVSASVATEPEDKRKGTLYGVWECLPEGRACVIWPNQPEGCNPPATLVAGPLTWQQLVAQFGIDFAMSCHAGAGPPAPGPQPPSSGWCIGPANNPIPVTDPA